MPFCKYCDEYVADDENACLDNDYRYAHPKCEDDFFAKSTEAIKDYAKIQLSKNHEVSLLGLMNYGEELNLKYGDILSDDEIGKAVFNVSQELEIYTLN